MIFFKKIIIRNIESLISGSENLIYLKEDIIFNKNCNPIAQLNYKIGGVKSILTENQFIYSSDENKLILINLEDGNYEVISNNNLNLASNKIINSNIICTLKDKNSKKGIIYNIQDRSVLTEFNDRFNQVFHDDNVVFYIFRGFKEINNFDIKNNTSLWQFPLSELGVISGSNVIDDIDSFLGLAHNNIWFYTKRGRLIALDIQTGKIVWKFSSHHDDKLSGYEICQGLGWIYFNEKDKCIYSLSSFFFQKIDTEKFEITDVIDIRNGEFEPLKKYSIRNALLQGDYFTFIACDHNSSKYRFLGIFNYITKELVWEYEMFTADSDNELLAPEPLYMTDNRLFIKDFQNTLHIFEKVKE